MSNNSRITELSWELITLLLDDVDPAQHIQEMSWFSLPEGFSFKVIFPHGGAVVRFLICKNDDPERTVSVYYDTKYILGFFASGHPYWEAYPINDDIARYAKHETKEMLDDIINELTKNPANYLWSADVIRRSEKAES